ncbi:hypothetical protein E1202_21095 [Saccharopolyspora karakumensis]|uniref:DUF2269 domain-containing protein n=1 Tax=Saccharopolyspora karakumensis TaxID=2530386 RepID=A0A4R5BI35_9PSEU|nr:hypothetical protein [Saccharopolyspora karakumensis]TDD85405.1 hypothetical protein E1202_21095 [Saccharopolyspora karakumensis]
MTTSRQPTPSAAPRSRSPRRTRGRLSARARRAVLLAHVVAGTGWFGIAAVTFVLTVAVLTESDAAIVRAGYEFHELLIGSLARPASLITLGTGLVLSVGTKWGVAKHYWPLIKLVLVVATIAITASLTPGWIADAIRPVGALNGARTNLVGMAVFHVLTIGAAAWLSIYKPGGRIRWSTSQRSAS